MDSLRSLQGSQAPPACWQNTGEAPPELRTIYVIFADPILVAIEFVAAAILLLNSFLLIASYSLSTRLPLPLLCS